ncbi:MAG: HEPN domain-containing protein [Candidatus Helarchaeota archaeon]
MEKEIKEIARQLVMRGEEKLLSAKILLDKDRYDDSISRSYYAALLAARGLLYLLGLSPKSHSGTVTMFGLRVIKEGLIDVKIGKNLNELFEARETSDYAVLVFYSNDKTREYYEKAADLIEAIKKVMTAKFEISF